MGPQQQQQQGAKANAKNNKNNKNLDDSFDVRDLLPTDDELYMSGDEDDDESQHHHPGESAPPSSPLRGRHKPYLHSRSNNLRHQQHQQQSQRNPQLSKQNYHHHQTVVDGAYLVDHHGGSCGSNRVRRWMVLLVLCASAVGMAVGTFFYIDHAEREEFQQAAESLGRQVLQTSQDDLQQTVRLLASAATSTTLVVQALRSGNGNGNGFPFVTLPDHFRIKAQEILELQSTTTETTLSQSSNSNSSASSSSASVVVQVGFAPLVLKNETVVRQWEEYAQQNQGWIQEYRKDDSLTTSATPFLISETIISTPTTNETITFASFYLPVWQTYPVTAATTSMVNTDLISLLGATGSNNNHHAIQMLMDVLGKEQPVLTSWMMSNETENASNRAASSNSSSSTSDVDSSWLAGLDCHGRCSLLIMPVLNETSSQATPAAVMWAVLSWDALFANNQLVLPFNDNDDDDDDDDDDDTSQQLIVEVTSGGGDNEEECGGAALSALSYAIQGSKSTFLGYGLLHDTEFDDYAVTVNNHPDNVFESTKGTACPLTMTVYPTQQLQEHYRTDAPWVYSACVFCVFLVATAVFAFYDKALQRRQEKVLQSARKTSAIVAELFPKNVQKRIIEDREQKINHQQQQQEMMMHRSAGGLAPKSELKNLIGERDHENQKNHAENYKGKPIADLFPETTIMFADIVGFTAWSSTREPSQVFTLLEGIYAAFDRIAAKRRVFKVETIGDCYVAVVGLPDPRKDHAVVMAKFARDCLYRFKSVLREMEIELGPDTTELGIRIGIHSGPTVAGVLRGERSRFQLFGDSVNTTARMESTGFCNRIHLSQETADLLQASGKSHWLQMRKERVCAKGKGELQTYWLATGGDDDIDLGPGMGNDVTENQSGSYFDENAEITEAHFGENVLASLSEKQMRLVGWNAEIMCRKLEDIVARREAFGTVPDSPTHLDSVERIQAENCFGMALDEVVEIIELPTYHATIAEGVNPKPLETKVIEQLMDYVQTIASMYHSNAFHNFEHASHVTMSVNKLLSRIIAPDIEIDGRRDLQCMLHDHTYGITSDPLTQFAVTLSALIHDVDHSGVPNAQLVKEHTSLAAAYNNKSVAEQNSVDIAWDLLMEDCYKDLRRTIYTNEEEFKRFRQLIVNTVLATDIMDKGLGELRKARWNKAFTEQPKEEAAKDAVNRKATIVIEHLIQASDVAHTMQHWHVYRKWNARLFREMYRAYVDGRADTDPGQSWYKGELGFFDFYVIPLAKKLKNCGVFGVSSDEYLTYATQNRAEWERKGQEVVAELIESVRHLGNPGNGDEEEKSFIPQDLIHHEPIAKRMSLSQDLLDLHDEVST